MNRFHEKTRLVLLTSLFAITLLSLTGIAYANTSTAPGQQWSVETRTYNPQGATNLHPSHATSADGVVAKFDIPSIAVGFTSYLWNSPMSLTGATSIDASINVVTTGAPTFCAGPWGGSPSQPVSVRLFFQANLPTGNGNAPCMPYPGWNENNYWWSTASYTISGDGSYTFPTVSLDGSHWTNLCGQSGADNPGFTAALNSAQNVGIAFGSHNAYAAGIGVSDGGATFQITSYTIS